ncbi:MAG: sigma-70 family RNA polymerase sigma factor [Gammaproteobacteria bacterium]|nr:sigma-70 family RNA polymerase sigma factor [Gammaproteobacteria bacterium]MDH5801943.1 sigma-70 family RNA polymerase sigma factor [Gammaproteobacteria bacterium]
MTSPTHLPQAEEAPVLKINPWANADDKHLMETIAQGNQAAFTEFTRRYLDKIVSFAFGHMGKKADAEDVAQEAFIKVWQKASSWRDMNIPPHYWLYRVTYNLCIDKLRKRKPEISLESDHYQVDNFAPEQELAQSQKMAKIQQALQTLPERQRSAIMFCAYHGFSNREAAKILETSVEALESLLARARRSLRPILLESEGTSL